MVASVAVVGMIAVAAAVYRYVRMDAVELEDFKFTDTDYESDE